RTDRGRRPTRQATDGSSLRARARVARHPRLEKVAPDHRARTIADRLSAARDKGAARTAILRLVLCQTLIFGCSRILTQSVSEGVSRSTSFPGVPSLTLRAWDVGSRTSGFDTALSGC